MSKKPKKKGTPALESVINEFAGKPGSLLSILEELQGNDDYNHLSEDTLKQVAQKAGIPASQVYSVATFYSFFNLKPQGKHTIVVCRGTACHTRGSRALLEESAAKLGFGDFAEDEDASFRRHVVPVSPGKRCRPPETPDGRHGRTHAAQDDRQEVTVCN